MARIQFLAFIFEVEAPHMDMRSADAKSFEQKLSCLI